MQEFSRKDFIGKLKKARKEQKLTQKQISEVLGIKRTTYARYENDSFPPLPLLYKICRLLKISADYLLEPISSSENEKIIP